MRYCKLRNVRSFGANHCLKAGHGASRVLACLHPPPGEAKVLRVFCGHPTLAFSKMLVSWYMRRFWGSVKATKLYPPEGVGLGDGCGPGLEGVGLEGPLPAAAAHDCKPGAALLSQPVRAFR